MFRAVKLICARPHRQILRPIGAFIVTAGVVAAAMAIKGWRVESLMLGGIIFLVGGLIFIDIYRVVTRLHHRATGISLAAMEAEKHYISVLRNIIKVVEARERYGRGRSERIGRLVEQIARKLSMPKGKCALLGVAGELHDIGLLSVPGEILNRRANLGAGEFSEIQKHCEAGYEVLKPLESLVEVLPGIRFHHERMNGTGYPDGLAGQDIPLEARIIAVADTYDAMTHDRPQRPAMTPLAAMEELRRCSPSGYDRACVKALAATVHFDELRTRRDKDPLPASESPVVSPVPQAVAAENTNYTNKDE